MNTLNPGFNQNFTPALKFHNSIDAIINMNGGQHVCEDMAENAFGVGIKDAYELANNTGFMISYSYDELYANILPGIARERDITKLEFKLRFGKFRKYLSQQNSDNKIYNR